MIKTPDRVSYSFGMKVNMGNYESADFHVSYSTDVNEDESLKGALARAIAFVEDQSEMKLDELRILKK